MKKFTSSLLALVLCGTLVIQGCSTSWVTTLDSILAAAAPALVNILQIIAIAEGKPVNTSLEAKVAADAATLKTLANDFADASSAAAPAVCSQLQAAITTYGADVTDIEQLAQISDPITQQKVMVLSALVAGTVSTILAVVPSCTPKLASLLAGAPPLPLSTFITTYNKELVKSTGVVAVDNFTRSHKLHNHGKLVRVLTGGIAK